MAYFRKFIGIALLWLLVSSAYAAMTPTVQFAAEPERVQLARNLDHREHVRQQLIELGVDPIEATERVSQMTDQQVSRIQGKITELPAGAGMSTTNLLLILIILILLL
ncbi:MAG: PA2779 family protein [Gammaproteobacteria bacterium]|nr:PA2779 family protein [Gammaproteobacteria bacterium]MDH3534585.1 PA2779 family protein [Gammaproteobacteria bacterium]